MRGRVTAADLRAEVADIGEDAGRAFSSLVSMDPEEDFSGAVVLLERVCRALAPLVPRMREVGAGEAARAVEAYVAQARALQETPEGEEDFGAFWEEVSAHVDRVGTVLVPALPEDGTGGRPFPELIAAFEATEYVVDPLGDGSVLFGLRSGACCPDFELLLEECRPPTVDWTVITAWNPRSVPRAPSVNAAAQGRLVRRLRELGYRTWKAWGQGPGGWREESLFVHGLDVFEAPWLAREFEQVAVLCGHRGEPAELVVCGPRPG